MTPRVAGSLKRELPESWIWTGLVHGRKGIPPRRRGGSPEVKAATERDSVRFGDSTIEYEVRRSPRRKKTVQITADAGVVRVAAPSATPADELRAIVRKRGAWILKHIAAPATVDVPRRFVSGETLPYFGRDVYMVVEPADVPSPTFRFHRGRFHVAVPHDLPGGERFELICGAIVGWYSDRAADRLPVSVDRWLPRFGHGARPRVLIGDQRTRWGSCGVDGTLRFNWRTVMLRPLLIDYIVVHELAHLEVRNHSKDFWALVSEKMPDAQLRRLRLREEGRTLPLW